MNRAVTILLMGLLLSITSPFSIKAQSFELEQLILNVTKLEQLRSVLKTMKDGYDKLTTGYNTVKDLSKGNFDIHKVFLDKLLQVSPTVKNYFRVYDILKKQKNIVIEYKSAFNEFRAMNVFSSKDVSYMEYVYDRLFKRSMKELDDLLMVLTAGELRMNDAERLAAIDKIDANLTDQLTFLRYFNSNTNIVAIQRFKNKQDLENMKSIYGLPPRSGN